MVAVNSYHNGCETESVSFIKLQNCTLLEHFLQLLSCPAKRFGNSKVRGPTGFHYFILQSYERKLSDTWCSEKKIEKISNFQNINENIFINFKT
jgi:hypothetical protein